MQLRSITAGVASLLLCSACVPSGHLASEQAATPVFDPITFFAGRTHGTGVLSVLFHKRVTTDVTGDGHIDADGSIVLDQRVKQGAKPATRRRWLLRRTPEGALVGTLTDASGPVHGEVSGNRLHLAFPMRGHLKADQWLYLQPGGQVARNRMVITMLGMTVASLDETITRARE